MKFQELHNNEFQALHDITKFTLYYIKTYEHQEPLDTSVTQLTTDPLFYNIANIIVIVFYSQSQSYFTTDGQSVSMSRCRAPLWGP
jgi:hypothetical protein